MKTKRTNAPPFHRGKRTMPSTLGAVLIVTKSNVLHRRCYPHKQRDWPVHKMTWRRPVKVRQNVGRQQHPAGLMHRGLVGLQDATMALAAALFRRRGVV
jgi:hypothetical protein